MTKHDREDNDGILDRAKDAVKSVVPDDQGDRNDAEDRNLSGEGAQGAVDSGPRVERADELPPR